MPNFHFTAGGRVPVRPLSYENVKLADNKELIADYKEGKLWLKKENGEVIDITASVSEVVKQVIEQIKTNPDDMTEAIKTIVENLIQNDTDIINLLTNISIEVSEGQTVELGEAIKDIYGKIDDINNELKLIVKTDEKGNTILDINIDISKVTVDDSGTTLKDKIPEWDAKTKIKEQTVTIGTAWTEKTEGTHTYYMQDIVCNGIKNSDNPIVDVKLSGTYEEQMTQLDEFGKVFRITTAADKLTVYATEKTEKTLNVIMKLERA